LLDGSVSSKKKNVEKDTTNIKLKIE
jgi:hypothetical protein